MTISIHCPECDGQGHFIIDHFGDGPDRYCHHTTTTELCSECKGSGRRQCDWCDEPATIMIHDIPHCEFHSMEFAEE